MRAFIVSRAEAGDTILSVLRSHLGLPWSKARQLIHERRVRLAGVPCVDAGRRVKHGQHLEVQETSGPQPQSRCRRTLKGAATGEFVIRFADAHVVVVEKPPGLTTMRHPEEAAEFGARARRFLPPTLADLLPLRLGQNRSRKQRRLRAVHRLDKETSGLAVFARTVEAERHLGRQFRAHTIERCYVAVVRGRAKEARIESHMVADRGDGRRGSTTDVGRGKRAVTEVRVVEELGDYTLVECRLQTGRTHQVRIHLAERGTPLCGERVYDRPLHGKPAPDKSAAPRLALHAASLGFKHPATGKRMVWHSSLPKDLAAFVARLRRSCKE